MTSADARAQLRELCYLRPADAATLGRELGGAGGPLAAEGWLHVALAEVRSGPTDQSDEALERARRGFESQADRTGLAWCDEVRAVALRRRGDYAASAQLQTELDARSDIERDPL
ncbi:MAG: hypothetical protein ACK5WT_07435, partial [Betaproteobacteria bacterium]